MFSDFTEEARKIIVRAKKEMYDLKHPYVGSEHLLLSILNDDNSVSNKLCEYGLNYSKLRTEIINVIGVGNKDVEWFLYTPLLKRIMENAIIDSKENNDGCVTIEHLFTSLLEEGEGVGIRIMIGMGIDIDKLYSDFSYKFVNRGKKNDNLLVLELGEDLTKKASCGLVDPVIGRDKEIKRLLEVLCRRTKNNPLLIGEAGVGKTAIVEELSRMIACSNVPSILKNKRIISLDMASLVAGTKYRGEFEDRVRKILKEIEDNDDIIVFIDEIHTLVGAGGAEGAIDASNIFKPALARGKLRCIGATTVAEYNKFIKADSALDRRFQKVFVEVPSFDDVKNILYKLKPIYEDFHNVKLSDQILNLIVNLSNKYIYDRNEPDRSIDVLDEVCSYVSLKENKILKKYNCLNKDLQSVLNKKKKAILENDFKLASNYKVTENKLLDEINNLELSLCNKKVKKKVNDIDVAHVIYSKTKIPVYEILNDNNRVINNILDDLKSNIVGQDKVIDGLINVAKRIKMGFVKDNKCYSMMFAGPSGVGKTYLATLFGKNMASKVIRLDMSEYSEAHSVSKIVGAPPGYVGYSDNNYILEDIKKNPYSVLILDEIERAHPSIINLFLQIFDNGRIKDSKGEYVRFDNVIIILTSNIGFNDINIGFNKCESKVISRLNETFGIPFVNRIDNIFVFDELNSDCINKLINKKILDIKKRYLENVDFKVNKKVYDEILSACNYKEYGARRIDKIIREKIENQIIDKVINKENKIYIEQLQ